MPKSSKDFRILHCRTDVAMLKHSPYRTLLVVYAVTILAGICEFTGGTASQIEPDDLCQPGLQLSGGHWHGFIPAARKPNSP